MLKLNIQINILLKFGQKKLVSDGSLTQSQTYLTQKVVSYPSHHVLGLYSLGNEEMLNTTKEGYIVTRIILLHNL